MIKHVTTFQGGTERNALAPKCPTGRWQYDFSSDHLNLRPIVGENYPLRYQISDLTAPKKTIYFYFSHAAKK